MSAVTDRAVNLKLINGSPVPSNQMGSNYREWLLSSPNSHYMERLRGKWFPSKRMFTLATERVQAYNKTSGLNSIQFFVGKIARK